MNRRGLVAHYKYHGSVDATGVWNDLSGHGNNGTLVGSAHVDNQGVSLDSTDADHDYVQIPASASLNISGSSPITISACIRLASTSYPSSSPIIVGKGGSGYWMYLSGNVIALYFNGTQTSSELAWSQDVLYHIVATKDSSGNWAIYRNAELVGIGSGATLGSDAGDLYIGSDRGTEGNYFFGSINDVRIYNRALSAEEIKQIYHETKGKH